MNTPAPTQPMAVEPFPDSVDSLDLKALRARLMLVDDSKTNLAIMTSLLADDYRLSTFTSGPAALEALGQGQVPDLVLLDVIMPEMDGYQVLAAMLAMPHMAGVPIIFVTGQDSDDDEEHGLRMGAVDYVTKPIRGAILKARIQTHLELKRSRDWLTNQKHLLEMEIQKRMRENELIKNISIDALALLAEKRDNETGNHLARTRKYVEVLIDALKNHPRFKEAIDQVGPLIARAAPLHDIGKVGIPDHILLKPGKLTPEEFEVMKTHSQIGSEALDAAMSRVLGDIPDEWRAVLANDKPSLAFLEVARQIALYHHEKWNGAGYPYGLKGDDIPVPARLMALADVYDALMNKRHYKPAFDLAMVESTILEGSGQHFDPDVVAAFWKNRATFQQIADTLRDE